MHPSVLCGRSSLAFTPPSALLLVLASASCDSLDCSWFSTPPSAPLLVQIGLGLGLGLGSLHLLPVTPWAALGSAPLRLHPSWSLHLLPVTPGAALGSAPLRLHPSWSLHLLPMTSRAALGSAPLRLRSSWFLHLLPVAPGAALGSALTSVLCWVLRS